MRLHNNTKRRTSSGNEMELSSPSQAVSDESPYVIPDVNGPYGSYKACLWHILLNTKMVRALPYDFLST